MKMMTQLIQLKQKAAWLGLAGLLALTACAEDEQPLTPGQLTGERISVLAFESKIEADPRIQSVKVSLPAPYVNEAWPTAGGYPSHAMHHLSLPGPLRKQWKATIGVGSWDFGQLLAPPIIVGSIVFAMDAEGRVSALDLSDGSVYWTMNLSRKGEQADENFGGGMAYDNGRLFVSTGLGRVVAIDPLRAQVIWEQDFKLPFRAAPSASDGRVFVITHDNQLFALDSTTGETLWDHQVIVEGAGLLGNSSPAVQDDTLVAPFTSGELVAIRVQNGRVAWQDILTRTGRLTSLSTLSDIAGRPVIDRGRVFAVSHSGRMVSIDLTTGERVWTRNIASTQTPWIAGDYVYVVTSEAEVVCLNWSDGRVRWVTSLDRWEDPEDQDGLIVWSGPVLGSDRLIVASSTGELVALSPYTGAKLGTLDTDNGTYVPPIVAQGMLLVLDEEGDLTAYR